MKGLKTRRWLLATTCALCCAPIWAEDYTEDGVIYDVNQSTKTAIVKGPANETVLLLNIKKEVKGCTVTSIDEYAFYGYNFTTAVIPSSVTSIGECAFSLTSLKYVVIPSSVTTIADGAFLDNENLMVVLTKHPYDNAKSFLNSDYEVRTKNDWFTAYSKKDLSTSAQQLIETYNTAMNFTQTEYADKYAALKNTELKKSLEQKLDLQALAKVLSENDEAISKYSNNLKVAYDNVYKAIFNSNLAKLQEIYSKIVAESGTDVDGMLTANDGLIASASQLSTNAASEISDSQLDNLIDGKADSYYQTTTTKKVEGDSYIQIDLNAAFKQVTLKFSKRNTGKLNPVKVHFYASNSPEGSNWVDLGEQACNYSLNDGQTAFTTLTFNQPYRYVRFVSAQAEIPYGAHRFKGNNAFSLSELHAYTRASKLDLLSKSERENLNALLNKAQNEIENDAATQETIDELQDAYDKIEATAADYLYLDFNADFKTAYSAKAHQVPAGLKAAIMTLNGENVRCEYRYEAGSIIPAQTGVLLKSGRGNSFILNTAETSETSPEGNLLHGLLEDGYTYADGDNKFYQLTWDDESKTSLGFYWGAPNGGAFKTKAGKAFLAIPRTSAFTLSGISLLKIDSSLSTNISNVKTDNASFSVYDLNGRRVDATSANELPKGIYVVNGKKTLIK